MHWFVRGLAATAAASGCLAALCVARVTLPPGSSVVAYGITMLCLGAVPCILALGFYGVLTHVFGPRGERENESGPARHCQNCGYDLTCNVTGICPECGRAV